MAVPYQLLCFIARQEAGVLRPYGDGKHFSQGFGHNSPDLTERSPPITLEEAWALLKQDVAEREAIIDRMLTVPLPAHKRGAMISAYFQAGNQVRPVIDLINAGNEDDAMVGLFAINRDSSFGKFRLGLAKRRLAEVTLFVKADYGDLSRFKLWVGDPKTTPFVEMPFPPETADAP